MGHRLENEMEGLGSVMLEARDTGTRGGGGCHSGAQPQVLGEGMEERE